MDEPTSPHDTLDGHCLAEEVIHALACDGLESRERTKALAHLQDCAPCRALLANEVRGLPESAQAVHSTRRQTLMRVGALVAGRYRIDRFVARGGMGEVYEAWDVLLSEQVALKTINPLAAATDEGKASARFKQEVQLSRRVADPHVCHVYEFGHHRVPGLGTLAYLTMEFIEGQTLGARLRKGPRLALSEVVELCRQMLRGLAAAHAVGVLHRDLKSDNVMLRTWSTSPGELHAVIMDFGLARLLGDQTPVLTERHELVGSVAYMAPEQFEEGAALSEATDVFAFGVVLFEMLTGRLPFDGRSAAAIAMRRLAHKPPLPSSFVPELSRAWDGLVLRCLERDVERRFASTAEVSAALEAIARAPSPRWRRRVALGVSALAVLVCALVYLALRSAGPAALGVLEARRAAHTPVLAAEPRAAVAPELAVAAQPPARLTPPVTVEPLAAPALASAPESELAPRVRRQRSAPKLSVNAPRVAVGAAVASAGRPAPVAAPPAPAAPDHPRDVRELFFLEGPSAPPPQNANQ